MVIFREPSGHRMVTTPVRRVLGEFGEPDIYVETENSVYRLRVRAGRRRAVDSARAASSKVEPCQVFAASPIREMNVAVKAAARSCRNPGRDGQERDCTEERLMPSLHRATLALFWAPSVKR
jgi:hypothetical protein